MKSFEERKLMDALIKAYRRQDHLEASESWVQEVMNHIRRLGPLDPKPRFLMQFEQLLWHFAPVACVLIVALAIYMMRVDFMPEHEIAKLFCNDPIGFAVIESAII
jgi:hypothetical protein